MFKLKVAYAIWPWGLNKKEEMVQALKDMKEVGFSKFESVRDAIDVFKGGAEEFKAVTDEYNVRPVSFYFHQTGDEEEDVEQVKTKIEFLKKNNVKRMSVQAPGLKGGGATPEQLKKVLRTAERMSRITKEYGVIPCIHPHANTMIMFENEIDFIMQNTDPEYISFGPDTAHLVLGKCDPVEIFQRYAKRIRFGHIKDIKKNEKRKEIDAGSKGFEIYSDFLELGEGTVDFKGVMKVLESVDYDGYMCVELDKSRFTNKESAKMSLKYLKDNFNTQP